MRLFLLERRSVWVCLLLVTGVLPLFSQDTILGDDVGSLPTGKTFCKPGVTGKSRGKGVYFRYGLQGGFTQKVKGSEFSSKVESISQFQAKVKIPLVNEPGVKALIGYENGFQHFEFDEEPADQPQSSIVDRINDRRLKTNKISIYITKSLNARIYTGIIARVNFRGDYDTYIDMNKGYRSYTFTGVMGLKPRENLEWALGINYTNRFFRTSDQILPFLVYNQTFNTKWGIESTLPAQFHVRYNLNPKELFLTGFKIQSFAYGLDVLDPEEQFPTSAYREITIEFGSSFEKQLSSWFWFKADAGINLPFRSEFLALENEFLNFKQRAGVRPYFNIGLFISPPKDMIK